MVDDVQAYVENECLRQLEDYLKRGRQLASLYTEELIGRLKCLVRDWANDVEINHREREDIMVELFQLRGVALFDRMSEEWAALEAATAARFERLKSEKLGMARAERDLSEKIGAFVASTKAKPPN